MVPTLWTYLGIPREEKGFLYKLPPLRRKGSRPQAGDLADSSGGLMEKPSETDLAYIAGFLDGEGTIRMIFGGRTNKSKVPKPQIVNYHPF